MSDSSIMQGLTLTSKEVKRLRAIHRKLRQRHETDVVKAIVLLGTGWIERQVAEALLYNRYYATFAEFRQACLDFFANLRSHRAALRTLLTENFEILSAA